MDLGFSIYVYLSNHGFDDAAIARVADTLHNFGVTKGRDLGKLTASEIRSSKLDRKDQDKLLELVTTVQRVLGEQRDHQHFLENRRYREQEQFKREQGGEAEQERQAALNRDWKRQQDAYKHLRSLLGQLRATGAAELRADINDS
jgi:hypothetical protein